MHLITEQPAKLVIPVAERRIRDKNQAGKHSPGTSHTYSPPNPNLEDLSRM